jgi:hypothetical protein
MVWQVTLVALPIYIVTWNLPYAGYAVVVVAITSIILKYTWYDHLKDLEHINQYSGQVEAAKEVSTAL